MKKIIIYTFLAAAVLGSSCKKFLDKLPTDAQPGDEVLKTGANVNAVLASAYERFTNDNFMGGEAQKAAELYGDQIDFVNVTGGSEVQFVTRQFNTFNSIGRNLWGAGYEAISRANTVIDAIDKNTFTDSSAATKAIWKGEALLLRGAAHFELVRLYAKPFTSSPGSNPGVVLRTKALSTAEAQEPQNRATVQQTYDQVIADLKAADAALPITNGARFNKLLAKAYLARVYFNMADYVNAYDYANQVITNGSLGLGTDVTVPFKSFPLPVGLIDGNVFVQVGSGDRLRGSFWNQTLASTYLPLSTNTFAALNSRGGDRKTKLTATAPSGKGISTKWAQLGNNAINVPLIRLAEMYLIRAEAGVQKGGVTDAATRADYNAVRAVAGVAPDNTTTGNTALLTAIRNERLVEFFTEGDGYHELRRLKLQVRGIAFDDANGLLKIPDSEIRVSPNMVQN
jgi:starch-binding outer membrane protein, SusD/RagB family